MVLPFNTLHKTIKGNYLLDLLDMLYSANKRLIDPNIEVLNKISQPKVKEYAFCIAAIRSR